MHWAKCVRRFGGWHHHHQMNEKLVIMSFAACILGVCTDCEKENPMEISSCATHSYFLEAGWGWWWRHAATPPFRPEGINCNKLKNIIAKCCWARSVAAACLYSLKITFNLLLNFATLARWKTISLFFFFVLLFGLYYVLTATGWSLDFEIAQKIQTIWMEEM